MEWQGSGKWRSLLWRGVGLGCLALLLVSGAQAAGKCAFVGSANSCQNAAVGDLCALNGEAGVCAPKDRLGNSVICDCVYGGGASHGPKQPHCQNGLRWSPSKESCIKAEVDSPDVTAHCFPPYYWDGESNTCQKLFE